MGLFVGFICWVCWFYLLVLFVIYFTAVALATAKKEGCEGNHWFPRKEGCEGHFVEPLVLRSALVRRSGKTPNPNHHTLFSKSYPVHIVYPGLSSAEYTANIASDLKARIIDKEYKYN